MLWSLQKQALTDSLENSYSNQIFGKLQKYLQASIIFKKISTMDVLAEVSKFSEQFFCRNTKIQTAFLLEHQCTPPDR